MKFGIFGSARGARGGPDVDSAAGYREFIDLNIEAEALGYESTFITEHHFTGFGQVSATLNLLTWIGAQTTTLRLGTAVLVLPWHNPVLLAEQAATVDLLSGGRLDFGIGKGYRWNEFTGFQVPMEEADERFEEALAIIVKAWTSNDRWSHQGKHWHFDDIVVEPPAAQKPHPPFWMGAGSPASLTRVAERGHNVLLDQFSSIDQVGDRVGVFRAAVEAQGRRFDPASVAVSRSVAFVDSRDEMRSVLEKRVAARRRAEDLAQRPDGQNQASIMSYDMTPEATEAGVLYGTPDEIVARIERLRDLGVEYLLLNSPDGMSSLRRFAREIMPLFVGAASKTEYRRRAVG